MRFLYPTLRSFIAHVLSLCTSATRPHVAECKGLKINFTVCENTKKPRILQVHFRWIVHQVGCSSV